MVYTEAVCGCLGIYHILCQALPVPLSCTACATHCHICHALPALHVTLHTSLDVTLHTSLDTTLDVALYLSLGTSFIKCLIDSVDHICVQDGAARSLNAASSDVLQPSHTMRAPQRDVRSWQKAKSVHMHLSTPNSVYICSNQLNI